MDDSAEYGLGPNRAPRDASASLPAGFLDFLAPLHARLTPRQQRLVARRRARLLAAHGGQQPEHRPSLAPPERRRPVELPDWVGDQRNQMTGPADDAELSVKLVNSGAPGVMLDLEDSMANAWPHLRAGVANAVAALHGELSYEDRKRGRTVRVEQGPTAIFVRPRGLHLSQAGIVGGELVAASLFDVALVAFLVEPDRLRHPLAFYIPKSESAEEAAWWRDLFDSIEAARGWPNGWIRAMALVESHPLAHEVEPFVDELRDRLVGLNLGRWDYMASLIHFQLADPRWVLPDRNTIPHDVPFFQRLREHLVEVCHRRGILAIGGMTALYPSRDDPELNARALEVLERDKRNEAEVGMDGAWTGHPDQNEIAVAQFPAPNQLDRPGSGPGAVECPDLRPLPEGVGRRSLDGTRAAVRTTIRYRAGVLAGRGASLLDGYMEDLATDRIYRLMLAQRLRHSSTVPIADDGQRPIRHTPELLTRLYDEELERVLASPPTRSDSATPDQYRAGRRLAEAMVRAGEFDPC
ncbi:MAG TPA: hypothetical protein VF763_13215 [Candidatus Limnocylindrales bacterium]